MPEAGGGVGDWWTCFTSTTGTVGINTDRYYPVIHSGRIHVGLTTSASAAVQLGVAVSLDQLMIRLGAGTRTDMKIFIMKGSTEGGMTDTTLTLSGFLGTGVTVSSGLNLNITATEFVAFHLFGGSSAGTSMSVAQIGVRVIDAASFYTGPGSPGPANFATASATRYAPMFADFGFLTVESEAQVKRRGASTIILLSARVGAARGTATSVFVRKNGADNAGSADLTLPASQTGFISASVSISLADGDQVNYRLLTGTGTGTLTIDHLGALISTADESEQFVSGAAGGLSWSSAARYLPPLGQMDHGSTVDNVRKCVLRSGGQLVAGGVRVVTIGSSTNKFTLVMDEVGGSSDVDTALVISGITATGWHEFVLTTPITLNKDRLFSWRHDRTAGSGSIAIAGITVYTNNPSTGISVFPAVTEVGASTVNPTVVLGSLQITPNAAAVIAATVNPTVAIVGDTIVTPAAAEVGAATVNPTVVLGSLEITPTAAAVVAATVNPTVVLGSVQVTPAAAEVGAASVAPTVVLGSLQITPAAAEVGARTIDPTVTITSGEIVPAAAEVGARTVNPTIFFGSSIATPAAAEVGAATVNPTVLFGSLLITPAAAAVGASTVNPTVSITTPPEPGGQGDSDYEYWRRRRRQQVTGRRGGGHYGR